MKRLSDKLTQARQQRFVGREAELELFRAAIASPEPSFVVLHIYGPGGIGKTTLLHELINIATSGGRPVIHLDGRNLEPKPASFEAAAHAILNSPSSVLLIDTYELLNPLDRWLRTTFLAQLPADTLIVIAGRHAPTAWFEDNGWSGLTRIISLNNLTREASTAYLKASGMPPEQQAAALDFTHGHPLALSLVAEIYRQSATTSPTMGAGERDVIRILLGRFLDDVPTDQHHQALELSAIVRTMTEDLLATYVGKEHSFRLFQWLRQLSFIEQGPFGLFPHDIVRDVLEADLYWRNPTAYDTLRNAALTYLRQQAPLSSGKDRQRSRIDILFANRRNPGLERFFAWDAVDIAYAETATTDDFPAILEMVQRHEGAASADIARHWLQRQPDAFLIYREPIGTIYGFMAQLAIQHAIDADTAVDPAVRAALLFVKTQRPLQTGEAASYVRWWMAAEHYQAISPAINITAANCMIYWTTTPNLVWSFVASSAPDFMRSHFDGIRFNRTPDADFEVEQRRYGIFSHNWVLDPAATWMVTARHTAPSAPMLEATSTLPKLSDAEFASAVRQALRDYTRIDQLATNPLVSSALRSGINQTPVMLQALLREAVEALNNNPKDAKLYRALWHTYIEPAGTQEQAADLLNLPFNTYRYHLSNGLDRLTTWLWRRNQRDAI